MPDFEFQGTGFSDFFEQLFGAKRNGAGGGMRGAPGGFTREAFQEPGDNVEADIMVTLEEASKGSIRTISLRRQFQCRTCGGSGQVNGKVCGTCGGSGASERVDSHKVKIPAGIREGQALRVVGQGEPGIGDARPGDL
jgi:curved DNA-binding protein